MWAQQLVRPYRFEQVEVPPPDPATLRPGQVLIESLAGGICGSDLPYFKGAVARRAGSPGEPVVGEVGAPLHEIVGRVTATAHPDHAAGDVVVGWASGFDGIAELVVAHGDGLAGYSLDAPPTTAVMLQPLACVLFACDQLGDVTGQRVAVIGQGPIGLLFSHVLRHRGAAVVTGVDVVDRTDVAAAYGVHETVTLSAPWWAHELGADGRPDVVVEAVGHQVSTLTAAIDAVATAGRVYAFGVPDDRFYALDMVAMHHKNVTLHSGQTLRRRRMLADADAYLAECPALVERYVTHQFGRAEVQAAFDAAVRPSVGQTKLALDLTG